MGVAMFDVAPLIQAGGSREFEIRKTGTIQQVITFRSDAGETRPVMHLGLDEVIADLLGRLDPDKIYEFTFGEKIVPDDPAAPLSSYLTRPDPVIIKVVGCRSRAPFSPDGPHLNIPLQNLPIVPTCSDARGAPPHSIACEYGEIQGESIPLITKGGHQCEALRWKRIEALAAHQGVLTVRTALVADGLPMIRLAVVQRIPSSHRAIDITPSTRFSVPRRPDRVIGVLR
jgi:hypothetical protein